MMIKKIIVLLFFVSGRLFADAEFMFNKNIGEDIGLGYINEIAYGNARNDGKNRFYVTDGRKLYEVVQTTWGWDKNLVDTIEFPNWFSNIVVNGLKGTNALYTIEIGIGSGTKSSLIEYSWSDDKWNKTVIDDSLPYTSEYRYSPPVSQQVSTAKTDAVIRSRPLIAAPARNDGVNRLYIALRSVWEYAWNGVSWTKVDTGISAGTTVMCADARNDGKNRLYVGFEEYEWLGGGWVYCGQLPFTSGGYTWAIGPGRNDGLNRFYTKGIPLWPYLSEMSWENGGWVEKSYKLEEVPDPWDQKRRGSMAVASNLSVAAIADGRNDGAHRIYLAPHDRLRPEEGENVTIELTWNGSTYEHKIYRLQLDKFLDTKIFNFYMTDTGLRNETRAALTKSGVLKTAGASRPLNKLYTSDLSEYIIAYPQPAYDTSKTTRDKLQPVNNYFKRGDGWASVWYWLDEAGSASLKIYNMRGELVRTLFDGHKAAGEYCEVWTGRNEHGDICSTGVYLVKLVTPRGAVTKKICMIK